MQGYFGLGGFLCVQTVWDVVLLRVFVSTVASSSFFLQLTNAAHCRVANVIIIVNCILVGFCVYRGSYLLVFTMVPP